MSSTEGLIAAVAIAAALCGAVIAVLLLEASVGFDDWPSPPAKRGGANARGGPGVAGRGAA